MKIFKFTLIALILSLSALTSCKDAVCPEGYTGKNCTTQITPKTINIDYFYTRDYAMLTPAGYTWDINTGGATSNPDVYLELIDVETNSSIWKSEILQNGSGSAYSFRQSLPTISPVIPNKLYKIKVWDYDSATASDLISTFQFTFYDKANGFPLELKLTPQGSVFNIPLRYIF